MKARSSKCVARSPKPGKRQSCETCDGSGSIGLGEYVPMRCPSCQPKAERVTPQVTSQVDASAEQPRWHCHARSVAGAACVSAQPVHTITDKLPVPGRGLGLPSWAGLGIPRVGNRPAERCE